MLKKKKQIHKDQGPFQYLPSKISPSKSEHVAKYGKSKHSATGHCALYWLVTFSCDDVLCVPSVQYYYLAAQNINIWKTHKPT